MTRADLVDAVRSRMHGPRRLAIGGAGVMAVAAGTNLAWTSFVFATPYPGKMSLSGFPGGARLFCLLLLAVAPLLVADLRGRRRAGLAGAAGIFIIAGGNLVSIAQEGGGLGAVAAGAWVTVIGGALLVAAFVALPDDRPLPDEWRRLPAPAELLIIAATLGVGLGLVVWGLEIAESSRFVSFMVFVGFAAAVGARLGFFTYLQDLVARHRVVYLATVAIVAVAFPFTQDGNAYWIRVFASIGVFAAAAIGLNVVVGLAGLLDLGYVAFFGVGAYVGALFSNAAFTTTNIHLPFLLVVLMGATIAAIFGVIIGAPTLRLRGDYLAIVTLGFGEIFRITANNWDGLTRGPNGISGIPNLETPAIGPIPSINMGEPHQLFGIDLPGFANYYWIELILLAAVIVVFTRLNDSRIGRAWVAIREDETAAAAMGVNTTRLKLLAFAIGAFLAGAAGTVNAHLTTQVSPDSYQFLESILLVAAVVLGGMGTVSGALLGSSVLFIIPEKLRSFQDKRLLMFGAALVLMMRFRPEGIAASRRRQREFHDADPHSGDAMGAPPGSPVAPA